MDSIHTVNLRYTWEDTYDIVRYLKQNDIKVGGRYSFYKSKDLLVFTHRWCLPSLMKESTPIARFCFRMIHDGSILELIQLEKRFDLSDAMHELYIIERFAVNKSVYGIKKAVLLQS